jgi:Dolichyl-phosphate-mannose-protein mannosyltransferase
MARLRHHKRPGGLRAGLLHDEDGALRRPTARDNVGSRLVHSFVTSEFTIIGALCIWALILRLPFFFPDTIDWDESTLIVMGQGLLDGFLPYERIWDSKPPLAFVAFAGAIQLLGRTVAALRFGGYLCVILTSYLVYRASYLIAQDKLSACVAALVSAAMMSMLEPALMTELLCVAPLSAALLLLFSDPSSLRRTFLAGVLIGLAMMIRTNLAVLALAVGGFVISRPPLFPYSRLVTRGFVYASGVLLIVAITVIPYLVSGRFQLWFDTVIRAGVEFSSNRRSWENLLKLVQNGFGVRSDGSTRHSVLLLGALLWTGGLVGLLCCAGRWHQLSEQRRRGIVAALVFLFGATISVAMTGPPYGHYLVQMVPWFAIFLGLAIASVPIKMVRWFLAASIGAVLIVSAVADTRGSYYLLLRRIEQGKSLAYGPAYEIAEYLQTQGAGRTSLFMMSDHLVYWLVGAYPPTRMSTHPSVLTKPDIIAVIEGPNATPESEIRKIIEVRPDFVVKLPSVPYLSGWPEVARLLEEALARDYALETVIAGRLVYRHKPYPR